MDNVKNILFAGDGICGSSTPITGNTLYIRPGEFDFMNVLTINPTSNSGQIVYEPQNPSRNLIKMNRTLYSGFAADQSVETSDGKKLFDLHIDYVFKNKYPTIKFFFGDGFVGLPTYAPFDKIIITAAAPFIPPKLVEQLKPGGIMVLPVNEGEGDQQRMIRITKDMSGEITEESFDIFSFVPMLTGKNR